MWDLIVLVPDHCLSFYFSNAITRILSLSRFLLCAGAIPERIPTSLDKVIIPTLRRTIPEFYRFSLCAEHMHGDANRENSANAYGFEENDENRAAS